ncbi:gliding motility-associated C-terminal domain-containing protein, partial [Marinobacterium sedimentorum]|uniref:T9SS type B sorting domain-containing protein n=1 Tax=Marinobacterium sedimentorum TaxID=2927804 RepID=UPI0034CFF50C
MPRYYLPTAFSPNGDGLNDHLILYLGPGSERIETLELYDRWGQLVWSYGPDSDSWDGRINGRPASPGVYSY